jgi:hypothetical protein
VLLQGNPFDHLQALPHDRRNAAGLVGGLRALLSQPPPPGSASGFLAAPVDEPLDRYSLPVAAYRSLLLGSSDGSGSTASPSECTFVPGAQYVVPRDVARALHLPTWRRALDMARRNTAGDWGSLCRAPAVDDRIDPWTLERLWLDLFRGPPL